MDGYGIKTYVGRKMHRYSGNWENGKKHGQGTQSYIGGELYEGSWKKGKIHGEGTLTGINGKKLKGEWRNGIKHGPGTEIYPDGRIFKAEWINNEKNGPGTLIYPDGTTVDVEWLNNILLGSFDFYYVEFEEQNYAIAELCSAIKADTGLSFKFLENTVLWLNEVLKVPNLYEILYKRIYKESFFEETDPLVENTKDFRNMNFSELRYDKQDKIKKLNRLLLEHVYPEKSPKVKQREMSHSRTSNLQGSS